MTKIAIYTHKVTGDYVAIEFDVLNHRENMRRIIVRLKSRLKQCIRLNNDAVRARLLEIQINRWESTIRQGKLVEFSCLIGSCPENIRPLAFVRSIAVTGYTLLSGWIECNAGHLYNVSEFPLENFEVPNDSATVVGTSIFAIGIPGNSYRYHYFNDNPGVEQDTKRLIDNAIFAFANYVTKVSRISDADADIFEAEKRSQFKKKKLREILVELRNLRKKDIKSIIVSKISCEKNPRRVKASEHNSRSIKLLMEDFKSVTPMTSATRDLSAVIAGWVVGKI